MQSFGLGAGMAALAFWGFVAVAVIGAYWDSIRKREAQHETVRRLIESGQPINQELTDKLLLLSDNRRIDRDFRITALWVLPIAPGLALLGLILGTQVPEAKIPIFGAAALLACIGIGFWVASNIVRRWYPVDRDSENY
jgi:hypothetical protein